MRVDELLNLFDLQDPGFVDFNGCDEHRFIRRIRPCTGLYFVCELWGKYHVNRMQRGSGSGYGRG